jgi:hypothetical protein
MKKILTACVLLLNSIIILAQSNNDPYKVFGHQSKVEYKTTFSELYYIRVSDTNSRLKGIGFDPTNHYIVFVGKNDTVLQKIEVQPEQIFRFISSDPLADKAPGWSPYRAFYNNPIYWTDPTGALEFKDYDAYKAYAGKNALAADQIGSQGHWLTSDRTDGTAVWDAANTFNIKNNSQNQYGAFAQVRDFYKWVDAKATSMGHEVEWMKGAIGLVSNLASWIEPGSMTEGLVNSEVRGLLQKLNVGIQNGTESYFNDLLFGKYASTPLKGAAAQAWDVALVNYEQGQVAPPIYAGASQTAITKMNEMANGEFGTWHGFLGFAGGSTPHFNWFNASVTTTQARIDIPLLMMYPSTYKPVWSGFNDKVNSNGFLNQRWENIFRAYQVK